MTSDAMAKKLLEDLDWPAEEAAAAARHAKPNIDCWQCTAQAIWLGGMPFGVVKEMDGTRSGVHHRRGKVLGAIARVVQHSHGRAPCRTVVNAASHVDDVGRDVCAMHPAIDEGQQRAFCGRHQTRYAIIAVRQPCIELREQVDKRYRRRRTRAEEDDP